MIRSPPILIMADYWEKTIQLYENFIDYPQMNDKHLKRPPFKYIFHIFLSTATKTGFAEGLLEEEELSPDFYTTPERKMAFLKKVFKFVYGVLNKGVPLKPASIIKGVECDKTNEFLQDLHQVAVSGVTYTSLQNKENDDAGGKNSAKTAKDVEEKKQVSKAEIEPPVVKPQAENKKTVKEPVKAEVKAEAKQAEPAKHGRVVNNAVKNIEDEEKILKKQDHEAEHKGGSIKMGQISKRLSKADTELDDNGNFEFKLNELKQYIQKITQNSNPMGKLVEFIDDDLDNMNKECKRWQDIYREASDKLEKAEQETEKEHQHYYTKLMELDEQIFEQDSKVKALKSQVLKNNAKVQGILNKLC